MRPIQQMIRVCVCTRLHDKRFKRSFFFERRGARIMLVRANGAAAAVSTKNTDYDVAVAVVEERK